LLRQVLRFLKVGEETRSAAANQRRWILWESGALICADPMSAVKALFRISIPLPARCVAKFGRFEQAPRITIQE
jgi:hypothetical protein